MSKGKRLRRTVACISLASVILFPACATSGHTAQALAGSQTIKAGDAGRYEDTVLAHTLTQEEFEAMFGTPSYTTFPSPETDIVPAEPETIGDGFTVADVTDDGSMETGMTGEPEVPEGAEAVIDAQEKTETGTDAEGWKILPPDVAEPVDAAVPSETDDAHGDAPAITILPPSDTPDVRLTADEGYSPSPTVETVLPTDVTADRVLVLSDLDSGPQLPSSVTEPAPVPETAPLSVVTIHEPGEVIVERYEPSLDSIFAVPGSVPEPTRFSIGAFLENNTLLTATGTVVFAFILLALIAGRIGGQTGRRGKDPVRPARPVQPETGETEGDGDGSVELMPGRPEPEPKVRVMDIRPEEQHYSTLVALRMQRAVAGAPETADAV